MRRAALEAELRRKRERRRRWAWALLLLLLLLISSRWWSCEEAAPAPVTEVASAEARTGTAAPAPAPVPEVVAPIPARPRPAFAIPAPAATPWVDALRVQVAARSPRLASCFAGVDRPGALRWTASVNPVDGAFSESALTAGTGTADLTAEQRTCVLAVLANPPFRLDGVGAPSTPVRVALVLEF